MIQPQPIPILANHGLRGSAEPGPWTTTRQGSVLVTLEQGPSLLVPAQLLNPQPDGSFHLPLGPDDIPRYHAPATPHSTDSPQLLQLAEERLRVDKRTVPGDKLIVRTTVQERQEIVDPPLLREDLHVERVPLDRLVDEAPPIREEGDTIIVPIIEEVLVVQKKLRIREELRIVRRRSEHHDPQTFTLRSETATVERLSNKENPHQADSGQTLPSPD